MIAEINPQIGGAPGGHGDPQREGNRDQRNHQAREQVVPPVLQTGEAILRLLDRR